MLDVDVVASDVGAVVIGVDAGVPAVVVARTKRRNGEHYMHIIIDWTHNDLPSLRVPVTKLGRLVKDGKIKSMEEIYLFSLPVKEYQIVDFFLPKLAFFDGRVHPRGLVPCRDQTCDPSEVG